jgi:hypothetical protein
MNVWKLILLAVCLLLVVWPLFGRGDEMEK